MNATLPPRKMTNIMKAVISHQNNYRLQSNKGTGVLIKKKKPDQNKKD